MAHPVQAEGLDAPRFPIGGDQIVGAPEHHAAGRDRTPTRLRPRPGIGEAQRLLRQNRPADGGQHRLVRGRARPGLHRYGLCPHQCLQIRRHPVQGGGSHGRLQLALQPLKRRRPRRFARRAQGGRRLGQFQHFGGGRGLFKRRQAASDAPAFGRRVGHLFRLGKQHQDGVAHPFGGAAADAHFLRHLVDRQAFGAGRHAPGQVDHHSRLVVSHRASRLIRPFLA